MWQGAKANKLNDGFLIEHHNFINHVVGILIIPTIRNLSTDILTTGFIRTFKIYSIKEFYLNLMLRSLK